MGKGSSNTTIGYHYLMDMLFGLIRGPMDELVEIKVGDKTAWTGSITSSSWGTINKPGLFGGEKKEGGIQGPFRVFMGDDTQVLPGAGPTVNLGKPYKTGTLPDVKAAIGGLVSEFRGVVTLWFSGLVSSMNPYPKEWQFRIRRAMSGWIGDNPWYPATLVIPLAGGQIKAMNGAHIIYELYTNKVWGRGLDPSMIDGDDGGSFVGAANTLFAENFGLTFNWQRQEEVDEFINIVQKHIGAVSFLDRETGKMVLRLIRNDYDPATLPIFTPSSGLLEIVEDDSSSQDVAINEIVATGHDTISNNEIQVRVQNIAARQSQGAPNSRPEKYPGIPTKDLLLRVAQRDLREHASGLKKFRVRLDRRGYKIQPGSVFRIQDTRRGIADIILRAFKIVDPPLKKGSNGITIEAVQDVFGLPSTSYVTPVDTTWTPPPTTAFPAAAERLMEIGYRDAALRVGEATAQTAPPDTGYIGAVAAAPNFYTLEYGLATRAVGEVDFVVRATGFFTGTATLVAAIGPLDTTFFIENVQDITDVNIGEAIMIDNEQMELVDFNEITGEVTVARGVTDTIPAPHALGARVWTVDDDMTGDGRTYVTSETVEAKILSRTSSEMLDEASAATLSTDIVGRLARPYPPGDVQLDGVSIYSLVGDQVGPLVLSWTHRDRLIQADMLIAHGAASMGPEPGTTYNVRVLDFLDPTIVLHTEPAIAGTSLDLTAALAAAGDPIYAQIELESERGGLTSWQKYRFKLFLPGSGGGSGYGYDYGNNYGGA